MNTLEFWWIRPCYSQHISKPCCTDSCKSYKLVGRELAPPCKALPPHRSFLEIESNYYVEQGYGYDFGGVKDHTHYNS